jgi:hypothetical protein
MPIELISDVIDNAQSHIVVEVALTEIHQAAESKDRDHQQRQIRKGCLVLACKDIVHDVLHEKRNGPVRRAEAEHTEHAQSKIGPDVGFEIRK